MRIQFKLWLLTLIISTTSFAQISKEYHKTFNTNNKTKFSLELNTSNLIIQSSDDDRIHIDYTLSYDGFSRKEEKTELEKIKFQVLENDDEITLKVDSLEKGQTYYKYSGPGFIFVDDVFGFSKKENDSIIRKTKDSIIKEIRGEKEKKLSFDDYVDGEIKINENGKISSLKDRSAYREFNSKFIVKIPDYIKINIEANDSYITIGNDITNELNLNLKDTRFKAAKLMNDYNRINADEGNFKVEQVIGGNINLLNVSIGLIGVLNDVTLTSELSKIEIGEIQEDVSITDFNSTYWFYNFSSDFKRLNLFSDYATIHHFYPKGKFTLDIYGNDTAVKFEKRWSFEIEPEPSRDGKAYKIFSSRSENNNSKSGYIKFNVNHGVVYAHDLLKR